MFTDEFGHGKAAHFFCAKDLGHFFVRFKESAIFGSLESMFLDVCK